MWTQTETEIETLWETTTATEMEFITRLCLTLLLFIPGEVFGHCAIIVWIICTD